MIEELQRYIKIERDCIDALLNNITEEHVKAVKAIKACKGKIIFMSVGKGSHIGKKLAATFSSLGISSFFVHATEACHGDLGMADKNDLVILMSNSGRTKEVTQNIEPLHKNGVKIVALTAGKDSELAKKADYLLLVPKCNEADDLNLAPTSSTTMTLVLGDAIACYLSHSNKFTRQGFFKFHPNGALGESLKEELKKCQK